MRKEDLIKKIRRLQAIFSIMIFIIVFSLCWNITGFDITEIQLSKWSDIKGVGDWWNLSLVLLSISISINHYYWIKDHPRLSKKVLAFVLFGFVGLCLFFTGLFDISVRLPHNFFAFSYFFAYPLVIFLTAHLNRKHILWRNWVHMMIISTTMIVVPISIMPIFNGYAISEILHTALVIYWNLWILKDHKHII